MILMPLHRHSKMQVCVGAGTETVVQVDLQVGHTVSNITLATNATSHLIIYAGYVQATPEHAWRKSGIIVANNISCVLSHL